MKPDAAANPVRRRTSAVPEITGLRFLPDRAPATLVNMSSTGLLAESAVRVRVGSDIAVAFEGGFQPDTITGRVARCEVAVMGPDGLLHYHIGLEFHSPLDLDDDETHRTAPAADGRVAIRNRW